MVVLYINIIYYYNTFLCIIPSIYIFKSTYHSLTYLLYLTIWPVEDIDKRQYSSSPMAVFFYQHIKIPSYLCIILYIFLSIYHFLTYLLYLTIWSVENIDNSEYSSDAIVVHYINISKYLHIYVSLYVYFKVSFILLHTC